MYELITTKKQGAIFVDFNDRLDVLEDYYMMRRNEHDTSAVLLIEIIPEICEGRIIRSARP